MMENMSILNYRQHMPGMMVPQAVASTPNLSSAYSPAPLPDGTFPLAKRLVITQQTCLVEEKFSKNGIQKNVHVVVKNNPFLLTLALLDKSLNFQQLTTEVQLVYDCPSLKEVDFVKLKPLEWKTRPNEEGDQLTVELRIKVLTSQLEDMFFRVKVKVVDPRTRKEFPHLSVLTHPIRVVSKPDQVRKKIKKRKRAPTDSLMDTLQRLEAQQRDHQRMLKKLCIFTVDDSSSSSTSSSKHNEGSSTSLDHDSSSHDGSSSSAPRDEFRQAFVDFLAAFKFLQTQDSQDGYKINTCANDAQTMAEVLDLVRVEVKKLQAERSHEAGHDSPCSCKVCPYKERMDKINDSYKEYLYSAVLHDIPGTSLDAASMTTPPGTFTSASSTSSSTSTPPPAMALATSLEPSSVPTPSGTFSHELYGEADDLLSTDGDASLANFLNLGGINGFSFNGFGDFNFASLEPTA
eukprot:TRINITY_DN1869_c0_g1_i3.p1 TRINITY_DN1869_c0_g1~~TRINITY_DN1869_c0_g1_i3.p1  ORF type:complete len:461 (-),score=142.85 TRINITY_DN1869_c0_g1_i3:59-1441(-)